MRRLTLLILLLVGLFHAALAPAQDGQNQALTVACDANYPPLSMINADGQPAGMLVDIWRLWSERTGRPVRFVFSNWAGTLDALRSGEADVHSGLFRSAERLEWMAFSQPFYELKTTLFFRRPDTPVTLDQLAGKRVAVLAESYQENLLLREHPDLVVVAVAEQPALIDELFAGHVDATLSEVPAARAMLYLSGRSGEAVALDPPPFTNRLYAGVLARNTALLRQVDAGFDAITDHELAEIEARWVPSEVMPAPDTLPPVELSPSELSWLRQHPVLRFGLAADDPPFQFSSADHKPAGLAADYLALVARGLGVQVETVLFPTSRTLLRAVSQGEVDVAGAYAPGQGGLLRATRPYTQYPMVFIARQDNDKPAEWRTVAIPQAQAEATDRLREALPGVQVRSAATLDQALDMIRDHDVDAALSGLPQAQHLLRYAMEPGIAVVPANVSPGARGLGVRNDWPLLADILDKSLRVVDEPTALSLNERWLAPGSTLIETSDAGGAVIGPWVAVALLAALALGLWIWGRGRRRTSFRLLVEHSADIIAVMDSRGVQRFVSPSVETVLGYTPEEQTGVKWMDLVTKADVPRATEAILTCLDQPGRPIRGEYSVTRKDGVRIHMEAVFTNLLADPQVRGIVLNARDVTQRHLAEMTLRESEQRMAQIIDCLPSPTGVLDEQGRVVAWNKAMEQLSGVRAEDILGKADMEHALPFYGQRRPVLANLALNPDPELESKYLSLRREGTTLHADSFLPHLGESGLHLASTATVLTGLDGRVMGAIQTVRDVTKERRAEAELRESRERFIIFMDRLPAAAFIVDKNHKIVYANAYAHKMLGQDNLQGKTAAELLPLEQARRLFDYGDQVREKGGFSVEERVEMFNGSRFFQFHMFRMRKKGESPLVGAMAFDVSERKQAEALREDVDRITRHDLKAPLNTVINMPFLLMEKYPDDEHLHESLKAIRDAGYIMLKLVNQSLDLMRMERGDYDLHPTRVDLAAMVRKLSDETATRQHDTPVQLDIDGQPAAEGQPFEVDGEEMLLHIMLGNLIKNAREASRPGDGVRVDLSRQPDGSTAISVHNKAEVPEQVRDRFFEKYASHGKKDGTGLGTYSARLAAETHGGSISMTTSRLEGTTVRVLLPGGPGQTPKAEAEPEQPLSDPDLKGLTILAVDDSEHNRFVIQAFLRNAGVELLFAENGFEAVEMWRKHDPDVILMDLQMPGMDGFEATHAIRAEEKAQARAPVPIVAVTAHGQPKVMEQSFASGVDAHQLKPIKRQSLLEAIARVTGRL